MSRYREGHLACDRGNQGEGGGPGGLLREVEGVGRGSERARERLVRSIEEDRAIGSAGRLREESEGGRRGASK